KKGQIIGTVGNTGNARTTPPHLHFGIYTWRGAINPLPYVKYSPKVTTPFTSREQNQALVKTPQKQVKKPQAPVARPNANAFPKQYIAKTITLPADPSAQYYVTTRSNVVRVHGGKYQVVGKWHRSKSSKYPYKIALINKMEVYVDRSGKLVTDKGVYVGKVS
ncbi:MAG TPA: M23 family metallopeptidase, partial [Chitinophagaceae bacterium]|nr:M23 family metallopeptidase [Chitinophagaceae bacterium]